VAVDGGKRVTDAGGNLIEAGVRLGIDAINSAFSGGTMGVNRQQRVAFEQAGGSIIAAGTKAERFQYGGELITRQQVRQIANATIRTPPITNTPPISSAGIPGIGTLPSIPGLPGGPSIADLPLPGFGSVLSRVVAPFIVAGLFWPRSAGRGSDLRDYYAVPAPAVGPKRRGRRRTRRRSATRPAAVPVPRPRSSSGPVTLTRPRVAAPPRVAVRTPPIKRPTTPPIPASMPPKIVIDTGVASLPASVPRPAAIPTSTWQRAWSTVQPFLPLAAPFLSFVRSPSVSPRPYQSPAVSPFPVPSPLTQAQTQPLSFASPYAVPQTRTDRCSCPKTRQKKKRNECRNPIVSKRKRSKDGRNFVTTTREIKCQASSRKKLRLPRVV